MRMPMPCSTSQIPEPMMLRCPRACRQGNPDRRALKPPTGGGKGIGHPGGRARVGANPQANQRQGSCSPNQFGGCAWTKPGLVGCGVE